LWSNLLCNFISECGYLCLLVYQDNKCHQMSYTFPLNFSTFSFYTALHSSPVLISYPSFLSLLYIGILVYELHNYLPIEVTLTFCGEAHLRLQLKAAKMWDTSKRALPYLHNPPSFHFK
jgi:hypothetical protein